jgi:beta-glucosidase
MVARDTTHPERANAGVNGKTTYSEGIFVGYRWFDRQGLDPLFPFGHGLSYTTFEYSSLKATPAKDGGLDVTFVVKNTGKLAGDDVPQVYIGAPKTAPAGAQFAQRALVQFDRVTVPAGASKTVAVHVAPWRVAPGPRTIYVGASSRDLRAQAEVNVPMASGSSNAAR